METQKKWRCVTYFLYSVHTDQGRASVFRLSIYPTHYPVLTSCQMLLKELNLGPHKYEFSSMAVSLALEGKASHRELTSRLLSDLSVKLLSKSDLARAFDKMLKELPDLILDTPEAPQVGIMSIDGTKLGSSIKINFIMCTVHLAMICCLSDVRPVHSQSHCRSHPSNNLP